MARGKSRPSNNQAGSSKPGVLPGQFMKPGAVLAPPTPPLLPARDGTHRGTRPEARPRATAATVMLARRSPGSSFPKPSTLHSTFSKYTENVFSPGPRFSNLGS